MPFPSNEPFSIKQTNMSDKRIVIATENVDGALTKGKEYEVIGETSYGYTIILDNGNTNLTTRKKLTLKKQDVPMSKNKKNVTGYKLKSQYKREMLNPSRYYTNLWDRNRTNDGFDFAVDSLVCDYAKKDNIMDMFEEVYEVENEFLITTAGKIEMKSNGDIILQKDHSTYKTSIKSLKSLLSSLSIPSWVLGVYDVSPTRVHIGCAEGVDIDVTEIKEIINSFESKFKK